MTEPPATEATDYTAIADAFARRKAVRDAIAAKQGRKPKTDANGYPVRTDQDTDPQPPAAA